MNYAAGGQFDTPGSSRKSDDASTQYKTACTLLSEGQTDLALSWFKKAAVSGHLEAAYTAGLICINDEKIRKQAFYWIQMAADKSHPGAIYQLALLYERGLGVAMNPDLALRYLRIAADYGNPEAQEKLDGLNKFLDQLWTNEKPDPRSQAS